MSADEQRRQAIADLWERETVRAILTAIADTHAKRGDVKQAPSLMSGGGARQRNRTDSPVTIPLVEKS